MDHKKLVPKIEAWSEEFQDDVEEILQGRQPKQRRKLRKFGLSIAGCVACLPCTGWSTLWRVIACPFQCIGHGPGFLCSNNGCTFVSDTCIQGCYRSIYTDYPWLSYAFDSNLFYAGLIRETLVKAFEKCLACEEVVPQRNAIRFINQTLGVIERPKVYILDESLTVAKFESLLQS